MSKIIAGYAALFNQRSENLGGFVEELAPGVFGDSLYDDIRALWQHDSSQVLGRTKASTLALWEDTSGIAFEIKPPDTQAGRDAVELIARGDVNQMSFGFSVPPDGESWERLPGGTALRRVTKARLMEISVVTWAAYPQTGVHVRMAAFGVRRKRAAQRKHSARRLLLDLAAAEI